MVTCEKAFTDTLILGHSAKLWGIKSRKLELMDVPHPEAPGAWQNPRLQSHSVGAQFFPPWEGPANLSSPRMTACLCGTLQICCATLSLSVPWFRSRRSSKSLHFCMPQFSIYKMGTVISVPHTAVGIKRANISYVMHRGCYMNLNHFVCPCGTVCVWWFLQYP